MTGDMGDLAFLFPGQGSQYVGMGKGLVAQFGEARRVFEHADNALGFSLSRLCFEGPEPELKKTENLQPALLTTSIAAFRVLEARGMRPDLVAGHSLGEYSALVAAGSLDFTDAVRLVRNRGKYMQEAVPHGVGAMAAILKLPDGKLDEILSKAAEGEVVSAANFNSPEQVVIAGHLGAVNRAVELAKSAGAKRAIHLPVTAPFHCSLMQPAQEKLEPELRSTEFRDLEFPLVNNWQAATISSGAEARQGLFEQIPRPVLWTESVREIARHGIKRFVEVGPGMVLVGLCRGTEPDLKGLRFGEPADLEKTQTASA
jgi:[acyl-carrier-protein] S-malonyltransferase